MTISNLIAVKISSTQTVSSLNLADMFEMEHYHLIRIIKRMLMRCPKSITHASISVSEFSSKRGKIPGYEFTKDGLLLLLPFLNTEEARNASALIISKLNEVAKDSLQKLKEANRKLSQLETTQKLLQENLVSDEFGTKIRKLRIPDSEKTILTYNEEERRFSRVKASNLSPIMLATAMKNNAEWVLDGKENNLKKLNSFIEAITEYYASGGTGVFPTPKNFGFNSEYQGFFERMD